MFIVDAHAHASSHWYEPVESLIYQMDRNRVAKAILTQYLGQYDNAYQQDCVRRYPGRLASVVLVDSSQPTAVEVLKSLAEQGAAGVRFRPETRSLGKDPLAIWRVADDLRLPVTCSGTSESFSSSAFADLVATFPSLPIILEHAGSVNHPDGEDAPYEMRRRVFSLARFPNVYLKIHGLGEIASRTAVVSHAPPFEEPLPSILGYAYEAFGPERMMWGSDYPPVSGREGYRNALRWTMDYLQKHGAKAVEAIFGGVAETVFGL